MSNADAHAAAPTPPPLSWPPPGLERMQGRLWHATGLAWVGTLILVVPLLRELAVPQPFWSLGSFGGNWRLGLAVAFVGLVVLMAAFLALVRLMRQAAEAAEAGFGTLTIVQTMCDVGRDTGFLIQGKRHFALLDGVARSRIARARIRGSALLLAAALWMALGFGLGVFLASRGFVTPSGVLLLTLAPSAFLLLWGLALVVAQGARVHGARSAWTAREGADRIAAEGSQWASRLDAAGADVILGSGRKGEAGRFRAYAAGAAAIFVLIVLPATTVAMTAMLGPLLAEIAVPKFLAVQEMAGAAETLRRHRLEADLSVAPAAAGAALQNLAMVGGGAPEPWERAPATAYEAGWFPDAETFPDPYSETVARDLIVRPLADFAPAERDALRQAAGHPAHAEVGLLARANLADVVSGRWVLPFPAEATFQSLPWPRFAAFRTAGLAQVARAAVALDEGRRGDAEAALGELISLGFLLMDQGPTLVDNLTGVVLVNMGGDALEAYYARVGRDAEAQALRWARQGARDAARKARAGLIPEDLRALLQGIPTLVQQDDALRGLRWEYFATFNSLAPCINTHKLVFGSDEEYDEWRMDVQAGLVRVRGEVELFHLAQGPGGGDGAAPRVSGFLPRFLTMALGSRGASGRCAALIARIEAGEAF